MAVRTSKILRRYHSWAVTNYGVECLIQYYPIEKSRVHELDWGSHMQSKVWCQGGVLTDFCAALTDAQQRWPQKTARTSKTGGAR